MIQARKPTDLELTEKDSRFDDDGLTPVNTIAARPGGANGDEDYQDEDDDDDDDDFDDDDDLDTVVGTDEAEIGDEDIDEADVVADDLDDDDLLLDDEDDDEEDDDL